MHEDTAALALAVQSGTKRLADMPASVRGAVRVMTGMPADTLKAITSRASIKGRRITEASRPPALRRARSF